MELQNIVIVRRPLVSRTKHFHLGVDARINIKTCNNPPLVAFLREEYLHNSDVLVGDIRSLLAWESPYGA